MPRSVRGVLPALSTLERLPFTPLSKRLHQRVCSCFTQRQRSGMGEKHSAPQTPTQNLNLIDIRA